MIRKFVDKMYQPNLKLKHRQSCVRELAALDEMLARQDNGPEMPIEQRRGDTAETRSVGYAPLPSKVA